MDNPTSPFSTKDPLEVLLSESCHPSFQYQGGKTQKRDLTLDFSQHPFAKISLANKVFLYIKDVPPNTLITIKSGGRNNIAVDSPDLLSGSSTFLDKSGIYLLTISPEGLFKTKMQ